MNPGNYSLKIYRGDTYTLTVAFTDKNGDPVDFSGSTWLAQIRNKNDKLIAALDIDSDDQDSGFLILELSPATTKALPVGELTWDLQRTSGTEVLTWLAGSAIVDADVSHD